MSVTRLKRKHRKNIARANNKQRVIKNLLRTPTLKNVDLEELKSRFSTSGQVSEAVNTVKKAAASAVDKVKEVAADVADAVTHSSIVEKAKAAVSDAVDAVTHSDVVEKATAAVSDAVDAVTHSDIVEKATAAVSDAIDQVKAAVSGDKSAENKADFADADAVTKPVNEDGQEGEHPKPEIAL